MNRSFEEQQQSSFLDLFKPAIPAFWTAGKCEPVAKPSQIPVPRQRGLTPLPPVPETDHLPLKQNSANNGVLPSYMVLEELQQQRISMDEMLETSMALNELNQEEMAKALMSPEESNVLNDLDQSFKMLATTAIHKDSKIETDSMVTQYISLMLDSLVDRAVFTAELQKAQQTSSVTDSEEEDLLSFIKESKHHQKEVMKRFEDRMNRMQESNERHRWKIVELERQIGEQQNKTIELSSRLQAKDHENQLLQAELNSFQEKENVFMDARVNLQVDLQRLKQYTTNMKQENRQLKQGYNDNKEKTSAKIAILKSNLKKAEEEVDDLSAVIERVVQFLNGSNSEFVCREDVMLQLNGAM